MARASPGVEKCCTFFMFGHWLYWTQILNLSQATWFTRTDTVGGWFTCDLDYRIYLMMLVNILPIKWEKCLLCLFEWFNKYPIWHIMDIHILISPVYLYILNYIKLPFGFINNKACICCTILKNITRIRGLLSTYDGENPVHSFIFQQATVD